MVPGRWWLVVVGAWLAAPLSAAVAQGTDDDEAPAEQTTAASSEVPEHGQLGEGEFAGLVYDADLEIWVPIEDGVEPLAPEPVEEPVVDEPTEPPAEDVDPEESVESVADDSEPLVDAAPADSGAEAEAPAYSRRVGLWIDLTVGLSAPRQVNAYVDGARTVSTYADDRKLGGYIGGGIAALIPVRSWLILRPSIEGYVGAKGYTDPAAVEGTVILNAFAPGIAADFVLNPGGKVVRGFLSAGFAFVISGFVGESGDTFQGIGPSAELGGGVLCFWGSRFKVGFHAGIFGRIAPTAVVASTHTTAHPAVEAIDFSGAMFRFGPAIRF